jgi:uncharacterized protein with FMN-binding domain
MKEILYTIFFILFLLCLAILLFFMFGRGSKETASTSSDSLYVSGVYTSTLSMDQMDLEVEVTVDNNHINSIRFSNLDESVETMYPLLQSSMETLSEQIISNQSAEDITLPSDAQYTSSLILEAVNEALKKAAVQ